MLIVIYWIKSLKATHFYALGWFTKFAFLLKKSLLRFKKKKQLVIKVYVLF